MRRRSFMLAACSLWATRGLFGAEPFDAPRLVHRLPRNEAEFREAHERAIGAASELVPANQPIERFTFDDSSPIASAGGRLLRGKAPPRGVDQAVRRALLAVGMEMTPEDQRSLPYLSGNTILDRVQRYFLSIQVRLDRDAQGRVLLDSQPCVAVCMYEDPRRTLPSTDLVDSSIRDIRSLGFYIRPGEAVSPDSLRTLVIVNRTTLALPGGPGGVLNLVPNFEWIIVRAQPSPDGSLNLHTFTTSAQRSKLHYLPPYRHPRGAAECGVTGSMVFTDYSLAGLLPSGKAMRRATVRARAEYPVAELDRFVAAQGLPGDCWEHLPMVLDSIIQAVARSTPPNSPAVSTEAARPSAVPSVRTQ